MEIDLAQAGEAGERRLAGLRPEVLVVGGGIAGLVLADRLASAGVEVALLEAGGTRPEPAEQQLGAQVELAGVPHLGTARGRTRALGGSSVDWGGQLLPGSLGDAWSVSEDVLSPFYREIENLLGVDDLPYGAEPFFRALSAQEVPLLHTQPRLVAALSKVAPFGRRNLGDLLGRRLRLQSRAHMVLHARAIEILLSEAGDRAEAALVRTPTGRQVRVGAEVVVVAAGTVETCRLLLASRARSSDGVGNGQDQVGRNFHDHLTVEVATLEAEARERVVRAVRPWVIGGVRGTVHALKLEASHSLRRRLDLNPALAHVTFEEPEDSGVSALRAVLRARQAGQSGSLLSHIGHIPKAGFDAVRVWQTARTEGRRYVSPRAKVGLRVNVAQRMPSLSRITLSEDCDGQGQTQARVDWRLAPEDLRSVRVFGAFLEKQLAVDGLCEANGVRWHRTVLSRAGRSVGSELAGRGTDEFLEPIPGLEDARHAMGGACLGIDPRSSVVDPELRVHGIENLFVASAAVFPDGRPQLPTMALMALTMRLAEHLRIRVGQAR